MNENPLLASKSADGVNLVDLAPPVYALSSADIPTVSEVASFSIEKKCHVGNKSYYVEWYIRGVTLDRVYQSKAKALARVSEMASEVARKHMAEAIAEAMKDGGAA